MNLLKFLRAQWDRALAVIALGLGILALVLGYIGISSSPFTAEQLPYLLSGGITGIFLLGLGATLYLSADLRDEWRKLDDLDRHVVDLAAQQQQLIESLSRIDEAPGNGSSSRGRRARPSRTTTSRN